MTVPFMGQLTNGVNVTRINMVTISDPVAKRLTIITHHIWLAPSQEPLQETAQALSDEIVLPQTKWMCTETSNINVPLQTARTATSLCRVTRTITATRTQCVRAIKANITMSAIALHKRTKRRMLTTYLKAPWALKHSMVPQSPSSVYAYLTQVVRARSSTSALYHRMSIQELVIPKWSPPHRAHIRRKIISMPLKLCFLSFAKQESYPPYIYVPFRALRLGTISS